MVLKGLQGSGSHDQSMPGKRSGTFTRGRSTLKKKENATCRNADFTGERSEMTAWLKTTTIGQYPVLRQPDMFSSHAIYLLFSFDLDCARASQVFLRKIRRQELRKVTHPVPTPCDPMTNPPAV